MQIYLVIVILAVGIALFRCRRRLADGHRPSVWIAVLASFISSLVSWSFLLVVMEGRNAFTRLFWEAGAQTGPLEALLLMVALSISISIVPAYLIVVLYQRISERREIESTPFKQP